MEADKGSALTIEGSRQKSKRRRRRSVAPSERTGIAGEHGHNGDRSRSIDPPSGLSGHQYRLHSYARAGENAAGASAIASGDWSLATGGTGGAEPREGRDLRTGRFLPGHRFWASRSTSGPAPRFADGASLWNACVEYFEWVNKTPLYKMQPVTFRGRTTHVPVSRMRPMTKGALCLFLGIERSTWKNWKTKRPDLAETIERVEAIIWDWQFTGAAAGLLDAGLVIRQLGLGRKKDLSSGRNRRRWR